MKKLPTLSTPQTPPNPSNPIEFEKLSYPFALRQKLNGEEMIAFATAYNANIPVIELAAALGRYTGNYDSTRVYSESQSVEDPSTEIIYISKGNGNTGNALTDTSFWKEMPKEKKGASHEFVASGAISSGDTVVLNNDGTVSVVEGNDADVGAEQTPYPSLIQDIAMVYDPTSGKIVVSYPNRDASYLPTLQVGTITGDTISFGAVTTWGSINSYRIYPMVVDTVNDKIIVSYYDSGKTTTAVATISGTTISVGATVELNAGGQASGTSYIFDEVSGKLVATYHDTTSLQARSQVGTIVGTTISWGATFNIVGNSANVSNCLYHPTVDRIVLATFTSTNNISVALGTVSGTTINYQTYITEAKSSSYSLLNIAYDPISDKVMLTAANGYSPYNIVCTILTITSSSIFAGDEFDLTADSDKHPIVEYNPYTEKMIILYVSNTDLQVKMIEGKIEDNAFIHGEQIVVRTSKSVYLELLYHPTNEKMLLNGLSLGYEGFFNFIKGGISNNENFIGISTSNAVDSGTGSISLPTSVVDNQSGLLIGSDYYIQNDGSLTTDVTDHKAGKALSVTELYLTGN